MSSTTDERDIQTARRILDEADLKGRDSFAGTVALMEGITAGLARAREEGARAYRVQQAFDDDLGHPGVCHWCGEPYEWVRPGKTQPTCGCEPLVSVQPEPAP